MKIFAVILIVIAAYSLTLPAYAQDSDQPEPETLVLTDEQGKYPVGWYVDILEDPGGELAIEDVTSPEYASQFVRSQVAVPNFGITDSVFWLRLRLRNETSLTNQWLLEVNFPNLNYVDLYTLSEQGEFVKKESGGLRKFDTREIPYYHVVFKQPLAIQDTQTIYLRVETGGAMTLAFTLWSPESFAAGKTIDMLWIGLFYGSLLMILGYHLLLFISLKEAVYFYFILVLASAIIFTATYEGVADQFLWPGLSQEKLYFLVITMSLFFMSTLKFSDVFLEQQTRAPRIHRIFYIFIGVWALMIAIVPFFSFGFMANLASILFILTPGSAILAGIYNWRKGYQPALFYLISWLGFLLGILSLDLVRIGILSSSFLTEKSYQLGLIWLVLLWSLALADRINRLKAQTEDANRALGKSESRLSQILEGLPLGVVVYENDQKPSYINKRSSEILGNPSRNIQPDPAAGRTLAQAMDYFSFRVWGSDQPYPIENMPITHALQGDPATVDDIEADLVDRRVPLEIWANPIKDDSGTIEQVVVAFQDITARKQAQEELDVYRNHLEQMVAKRTAEISAINDQLNHEVQERQFLEVMLHKRIEWLSAVNRVHQRIRGPADLGEAFDNLSATIVQFLGASSVFIGLWDGKSDQIEALYRNQTADPPRAISFSSSLLKTDPSLYGNFEQGKLIFLTADQARALPDLTGQFTNNGDQYSILLAPMKTRQTLTGLLGLEIKQQRYEDITGEEADLIERLALDLADLIEDAHLLDKAKALAANEERNRLARDLHDSVTQVLFSASLVAEVLPRIWKRDPETAQRSLEELQRLTRSALAEMRTLLLELRPASVVKSPLGELLAQLTEAVTSRGGLLFQLFFEQTPVLPEDVHLGFYRIAQEGLNNVVKHAKASLVTVSLIATPSLSDMAKEWRGEVKLVIRDNGVGFADQAESSGHMGLNIIRERARSINADISINSQPGSGTELILTWHN